MRTKANRGIRMEVVHISQAQLAARWQVAEATVERWRSTGIGPRFLKLLGNVRYRLDDVQAFEECAFRSS
jgi:hypothetical protein